MDELLRDFLTETGDHVEAAGVHLVQLERDPSDMAMIASIFRLLHTIKGTCGFLGLSRLGKLAHAAEALLSRMRDGAPATEETVNLILTAVDRIRFLLAEIEARQTEPVGGDEDLIDALEVEAEGVSIPATPQAPVLLAAPLKPLNQHSSAAPSPDASRAKNATVRIGLDLIETMVTLVSELVLTRNQLAEVARRNGNADVTATLGRLSSIVSDLQDQVMRARMQPLDRLFGSLPRLARDLARELGKEIDLVVEGGDSELDRQLIEVLRDPMTHLIRNCADHGLESTAARVAAGKPAAGTIRVVASHIAGQIRIEVSDDGRGLDLARIGATALRRGVIDEAALVDMTIDDVARLIFAPGFSTAAAVTSISGRGVGLDVVRANIETAGGDVTVASEAGVGACFTIRLPLTLAIAPALIVRAGGQRLALPQFDIAEIVSIGADSPHICENVGGVAVLSLRGEVLPLVDLAALLQLPPSGDPEDEPIAAIVRCGDASFALLLDRVEDVQEIVVKPIGAVLAGLRLYAGHTILGDGGIVLILDPPAIASTLGVRRVRGTGAALTAPAAASRVTNTRILTFRAGSPATKALPLSIVKRIETVRAADIERSAGRLVVQRDDGLIALLPLVEGAPLREPEQPVLIIEIGGHTFGLLVDEIVDVVDAALEIAIPGLSPGALGAADVGGTVTEIVDADGVFRDAHLDRRVGFAKNSEYAS